MEIQLTSDQVLALAPDSSSASAGKKLGNTKHWQSLGGSTDAIWGECQGSGKDPYQVKIELASLTSQCSCPSRKFPCKHGLGLLLLAVSSNVPAVEAPEWVTSWLEKRQASTAKRQERVTKAATEPPSATQLKTAEKRLTSVKKGLDTLDIWLNDLVRQGLASVQSQPLSFWEDQAVRLRNAQAGALDTRVRALAAIPNASPDWPEKLLDQLGKLALLTHAFQREEQLDAGIREDVRQLIGWTYTQDEVGLRGEILQDDWLVLGQVLEETERGKTQRTWLHGLRSGRQAVILQFSIAGQAFAERFAPGSHQEAELAFWPGAYPQRAYMRSRQGEITAFTGPWPGVETIDAFFAEVAESLGRQPWLEHFLCLLHDATFVCQEGGSSWFVLDRDGYALPMTSDDLWGILAQTGGHPVNLAAEWDGKRLRPLSFHV